MIINPFAGYAGGFLLALAVYSLGYSDLYPPLQPQLSWFLLSTSAICLFLARAVAGDVPREQKTLETVRKNLLIFIVVMGVFALETVVNHGLPILLVSGDTDTTYQDFGIPVIHVAFFGFCYFFAVYWFDVFLLGGGLSFLAFSLSAAGTALLMFSRGALIITLIALLGVYIQRRGLRLKLVATFFLLTAVALWGFGRLGDIRVHGATGESVILTIGDASDKFLNSSIPTELFWPYLYTSSPLANLQLNINERVPSASALLYFELQFFPDFISKRLVSEEVRNTSVPVLIADQLTVTTMYGWSYSLFGWPGIWLSFIYFIGVSLISMKLLQGSRYFVAGTAILTSLGFLGIFDNMYINAGGSLQVIVAILLSFLERKGPTIS